MFVIIIIIIIYETALATSSNSMSSQIVVDLGEIRIEEKLLTFEQLI